MRVDEHHEQHPPTPVITNELGSNGLLLPMTNGEEGTYSPLAPYPNHTGQSFLSHLLKHRQLQQADLLFTTSDYELITELHSALKKLKRIFNEPNYSKNQNDQSIVELVLARLTNAIRDSSCIETYGKTPRVKILSSLKYVIE